MNSTGKSRRSVPSIVILAILVSIVLVDAGELFAQSAAQSFQNANKSYVELCRDAKKRKQRTNWIRCINSFSSVYKKYPETRFAPKSMYISAKLYEQLYGYSSRTSDLKNAVDTYTALTKKYPKSSLADDALYKAGRIYERRLGNNKKAYEYYRKIITVYPKGDMAQSAREGINSIHIETKPGLTDLALVKGIRQWTDKDYTRVVIDLEKEVPFDTFVLPPNKKKQKSHRLVLDLNDARTPKGFPYKLDVNEGELSMIRISQNRKDKVRVVMDFGQKPYYHAFPLNDPSRLVIDVSTKKESLKNTPPIKSRPKVASSKPSGKSTGIEKVRSGIPSQMPTDVPSIARQLSLKVSTIVIDPGHGGKDPGAIGPGGVKEKDIVLSIGKMLAARLRKEGFKVYMTRDKDVFIPLEERTAFANNKKADLFISLHANANEKSSIRGVETFFLNLTTDASAIQVAARENATTSKSLSDLQLILNDLMLNSKINESSKFADSVQKSIMSSVGSIGYRGRNLGIKQAPFYVLLGAQMPSILIEMGFITNSKDCSLLRKNSYRQTMVNGIAKGINEYIINTTYAYYGRNQ